MERNKRIRIYAPVTYYTKELSSSYLAQNAEKYLKHNLLYHMADKV
jgi:hypothetical protein